MSKDRPDHHDAELVLKLYELRREEVMRESRTAMIQKFWPRSFEEFVAVTKIEHPLNAAFRQVSSYWEMVYSFAKHGIVNADFLVETNGEGMLLFAKVLPFLEQFRKDSPTAFKNCEWIATNCETGKQRLQLMRMRVEKLTPPK